MTREEVTKLATTVAKSVVSQIPGFGGVVDVIEKITEQALEKRKQKSIDILIERLSKGVDLGIEFSQDDAGVFVQMLLRFFDAVNKGTAEKNLRMLADTIAGLKRSSTFEYDRFQRWSSIVETLTESEIDFLAVAYALRDQKGSEPFIVKMKQQLSPRYNALQVDQIAATLIRTGLIIPHSAYGGLGYTATTAIVELCELAKIHSSETDDS